jgi:hypothetical protein
LVKAKGGSSKHEASNQTLVPPSVLCQPDQEADQAGKSSSDTIVAC